MGTRTITAAFSSRAQAELARERLRQLGIGADAIRISDVGEKTSAGRAARLEITGAADENLDPISALLKRLDAGRIDSHDEEWPPPDQAWLGHHQGRVTGTKVPAGQGDAETGSPLPPEAENLSRDDRSGA